MLSVEEAHRRSKILAERLNCTDRYPPSNMTGLIRVFSCCIEKTINHEYKHFNKQLPETTIKQGNFLLAPLLIINDEVFKYT